ncbi:MAG TPA: thioredoxin domain-containing protein [Humibacter sp.]|nr:thioredoxin domain-containing protein [Humibacter sp.]
MTNSSSAKKARRNAAREHARLMREEAAKKAKRRRIIVQSSIGAGILVVLLVIVLVVIQVAKPAQTAGPQNMLSDGIVLTSTTSYVSTAAIPNGGKPTPTKQANDGKAHITLYEDLQCPVCQQFEKANDQQIVGWLNAGTATVEIHPVSILDRLSSGNRYSSRAANAMACVAQYDPKDFWAVNRAFYDDQPKEGSNGRTNTQILATMRSAGVDGTHVSACVNDETFKGWVTAATNRITPPGTTFPNSKVTVPATGFGTPTIIVNGKAYTPPNNNLGYADTAAFATFVKGLAPKVG